MLEKMFWFLDGHIFHIHILNFVASVTALLVPLWVCEVTSLIYGIVKGYFS